MDSILPNFRKAGFPIIHVGHSFAKNVEASSGRFYIRTCEDLGDLIATKKTKSAFNEDNKEFQNNLEDILKNKNINKLIIAGVCTNYCVEAAVLDALSKKFNVCVLEDLVANAQNNEPVGTGNFQNMQKAGAFICDSSDFLPLLQVA